jgi:hypothetical protein
MSERSRCPQPEALLAALRGEGPEDHRLQVLDHALSCPACRPELALLHSVSGGAAQARPIDARPNPWRRFVPLALAATLLIAAGFFGVDWWRTRASDEPLRSGGVDELVLTAPADAARFTTGSVTFVWHRLPGALRYTLELDAADGTVLFAASTADTLLAAQLDTLARGEHRWSVRARMDDGSERRSNLRHLRLK